MSTPTQPTDEWDYVPTEADDERLDEHRDPEVEALHVDHADGARPAEDPARADDSAEREDPVDALPEDHYPDEEYEQPRPAPDDEHEPDLEEILESQHYAFADEPDED